MELANKGPLILLAENKIRANGVESIATNSHGLSDLKLPSAMMENHSMFLPWLLITPLSTP